MTSTQKVHLKKPSIADGSLLEQTHVTKKPKPLVTPSQLAINNELIDKSELLKSCLGKLRRKCSLRIADCKVDTDIKVVTKRNVSVSTRDMNQTSKI